jgi:molecular chaperone DnaK
MVREAESHAAEDEARRKEIETRNQADSMAWNTEKLLREHGDKLGAHKSTLEGAVKEVRDALAGDDAGRIERALSTLTEANHKASEAMYAAVNGGAGEPGAGGPGGPGTGGPGANSKGGDDVIDAEFEETR